MTNKTVTPETPVTPQVSDAEPIQNTTKHATRTGRRRTRKSIKELTGARQEVDRDIIVSALTASQKSYETNALIDPFGSGYNVHSTRSIEEPPYNLVALSALVDKSNIIRQCIDAYVTNIEATGHTLRYIGPEGQEESAEALREFERLSNLLEQPNGDYDILELRERGRRDSEAVGAQCIEVIRTPDNSIAALYHLPTSSLRLTGRDEDSTEVIEYVKREGVEQAIKRKKRFRRFVQKSAKKDVYFKEFGDHRPIDPEDGEVNESLAFEDQATEILYIPQYKSGYSYGVPRWVNNMVSIMGSRESELTNLAFFSENAIPAMAVTVSGGSVTDQTVEEIQEYFEAARGREAHNRILIFEAVGDAEAADDKGRIPPPRIELKPMTTDRQNDALFQEYEDNNQKKVRSSFRLNPILLGLSEDMTQATAKASLRMTEEQVFGPERNKIDKIYNIRLLADKEGRPPTYWAMKSNPPRTTDIEDMVDALTVFDTSGALTPNIAIELANEVFGTSIERREEPWGDFPFAITKALVGTGSVKGFEDLLNEIEEAVTDGVNEGPDDVDDGPDDEGEEPPEDLETGDNEDGDED